MPGAAGSPSTPSGGKEEAVDAAADQLSGLAVSAGTTEAKQQTKDSPTAAFEFPNPLTQSGAEEASETTNTEGQTGGAGGSGSNKKSGSGTSGGSSRSRFQNKLTTVTHMLFFASQGDVEAISALIDEENADVNAADYDGRSPLHLAASEGKLDAVRLLLDKGANVNPKDRWQHTPLTDAKKGVVDGNRGGQFKEIVDLLVSRGGIDLVGIDVNEEILEWELDPTEIDLNKSVLIGKGAFGEIRRVTWRGTPVAVKTVLPSLSDDPQIVKEFKDEVALLPKLRHPNIVQFLGCVTTAKPLMLVTEYLSGGDLHEVLKEYGPLPAPIAVGFALDVARGMNYLHNHRPEGIIHRDLKPRNLLRDEGDHLKVADFGLSKLVKMNALHEVYKMTGETGSYRYMAPEVFRHEAYDSSVDVYSFAIIFHEMFEGTPPFAKSMTAEGMAWKVAMESIRPPFKARTYPPGAKELITECWSANARTRPPFSFIIERLEHMEKLTRLDMASAKSSSGGKR